MNSIDPEKLKMSQPVPLVKERSTKRRKMFIKGPIPLRWIRKAAGVKGKALHVAVALWFLAGLKRSQKVTLSQSKVRLFGVSRQASYRALVRLEGAGLVAVERHRGRSPIVTIQLTDTD
jgi:DNA-binding transcriptional ArsR family regulator